MTTLKLP